MLKVGICEDNIIFKNNLKNHIETILKNMDFRVYEFSAGEELLEKYPENLDILLLDIQMNDLNGIETARNIRKFDDNIEIIFITGLIEYSLSGYEVRAYRYLLKPIKYDELATTILECTKVLKERDKNCLLINSGRDIVKIPIHLIIYIEKISRYIRIHTDKNVYVSRMNIKDIESRLENYGFFRCHTGYLINLNKINTITLKNEVLVKDVCIPVSRNKIKPLKLALMNYLGEFI